MNERSWGLQGDAFVDEPQTPDLLGSPGASWGFLASTGTWVGNSDHSIGGAVRAHRRSPLRKLQDEPRRPDENSNELKDGTPFTGVPRSSAFLGGGGLHCFATPGLGPRDGPQPEQHKWVSLMCIGL